jgi:hypothetical protein
MTEPMFGFTAFGYFDNNGNQIGRTRYGVSCKNTDCVHFDNDGRCAIEEEIVDDYGLRDTIPYERVNKIQQMTCDKYDGVTSKW